MIAQELEVSLHMAFVEARQKRHEFITVEHLLLALLDNPTAAEVLRACGANMDELRKNLTQHIAEQTPRIAADREVDTQPTLGFQRVIQRAILHVQSSGKKEVTGANVLVAIFGEKDSHAVYFLQQQGIARLDVVNYISHGITKTPQARSTSAAVGLSSSASSRCSTVMNSWRFWRASTNAMCRLTSSSWAIMVLPYLSAFLSAVTFLPSRTAAGAGASGSMPRLAALWCSRHRADRCRRCRSLPGAPSA